MRSSLNSLVESFLRVFTGDIETFLAVSGSIFCTRIRTFLRDVLFLDFFYEGSYLFLPVERVTVGTLLLGIVSCLITICCSDFLKPNIVGLRS